MPNLVLTNECNSDCQYCFVQRQEEANYFTLDKTKQILPFLRSFQRESLNIVGGEPTLNPDFIPILNLLLTAGFKINIFTNGRLPQHLIAEIHNIAEGEFSFCVNRTNPELSPEMVEFYRMLGYRIQLGITIFEPKQELDHLLNEIEQFNLERHYRIGIALPIWPGKQNSYLDRQNYQVTSDFIFLFIQKGFTLGIKPEFDCGIPYCFFSPAQKSWFVDHEINFISHCGLIPDICPDFSVIPCFPLATFCEPISMQASWTDLKPKLEAQLNKLMKKPIFPACATCLDLENGKCPGGCLALRLYNG
jgi:MoaA/NifB/PqqE/SkfB family radical SAM enzyme